MSTTAEAPKPLAPRHKGPTPMYGERTVPVMVYVPESLKRELEAEVATRNRRRGTGSTWSMSNLVVSIVAKELGVEVAALK